MERKQLSGLWPALLNRLDTAVAVTDSQGRATFVNVALERMFEIDRQNIIGAPITKATMKLVDAEGRPLTPASLPVGRVLATAMAYPSREFQFNSEKSGPLVWVVSASPVLAASGDIDAVILTATDVTELKHTMVALQLTENRFRELAEQSRDLIAYEDAEGVFQYVSPAARSILGYDPLEMIGRRSEEFVHPDQVADLRQRHSDPQDEFFQYVFQAKHKDGSYRWLDTNCTVVSDSASQAKTFLVICRDITERRQASEAVRKSEAELALAQQIAHLGSFEVDYANNELYWSRELYRIYGEDAHTYKPSCDSLSKSVHPDDLERVQQAMDAAKNGRTAYELEHRILMPDGSERWVLERGRFSFDASGKVQRLNGIILDVTERKAAEERAAFLATHDPLTGLPYRHVFVEYLSQAIRIAKKRGEALAVMCIDPDRFKVLNESLGHDAGDELLVNMSERIRNAVDSGALPCRLAGATFALGAACENVEEVVSLAARLHAELDEPYKIQERDIVVTTSIGMAVYPNDADTPEGLIRGAEAAMYRAKAAGRDTLELARPELHRAARDRLTLEQDLRHALSEGQLTLHYQPIGELRTGRITGCEALLRWNHPTSGLLLPDHFIHEAEETGLIIPIGEWVLETACETIARLSSRFKGDFFVAVNISARQLQHAGLPAKIRRCIEMFEDGSPLVLELVESTVMADPSAALRLLQRLKSLGARIAVDDFGTGYSSLAYLKRFPLDTVKIDRTFVRDLETDENDAAIASSIITLAHSLGLRAVAEGVETSRQLQILQRLGCDFAQGFYLGRPVPASEFDAVLAAGSAH